MFKLEYGNNYLHETLHPNILIALHPIFLIALHPNILIALHPNILISLHPNILIVLHPNILNIIKKHKNIHLFNIYILGWFLTTK